MWFVLLFGVIFASVRFKLVECVLCDVKEKEEGSFGGGFRSVWGSVWDLACGLL